MRALALLACATPLALNGCRAAPAPASASARTSVDSPAPRPARINHLAFFKLKNPADAAELVADCDRMLGTIPGVVSYFAGTHLDTGRGARVDSDYDVGFYVGFHTEADYARYVEHPQHTAAVEKWQPRWQWIRVIDVVDDSP